MTDQVGEPMYPALPEIGHETDWEYDMRREMQEVIPGLYLGPYSVATKKKLEYLTSHLISHVVCIRHPVEANRIKPNFPEIFQYLVLEIIDSPTENIIQYFAQNNPGAVMEDRSAIIAKDSIYLQSFTISSDRKRGKVKAFIDSCLKSGGRILVHGSVGMSRRDAHGYVQGRRFCVNPNEGFIQQLQEYEMIYLARHQIRQSSSGGENCASSSRGLKRGMDHEENTAAEYQFLRS